MKKIQLMLAMLIVSFTHAQNSSSFFTTMIGPQIKDKDRRTDNAFLSTDNNGNVYFARTNISSTYKSDYVVDKLDKNLKLVQTKELSFNATNHNKTNINLDVFRNKETNKLYLIGLNDNGSSASISALEIKQPDMLLASTGKLLDDGLRHEVLAAVHHSQLISPDSNIIAYVSQMNSLASNDKYGSLLHASVFNTKLDVLWTGNIQFPFEKGEAEIRNMCIGDDGYLNIIVASYPGKKLQQISNGYYSDYSLVKWKLVRTKGKEVKTIDFSLKDGDISFPRAISAGDEITITGVYCKGLSLNAKGVFSMRISPDGKVVNSSATAFPSDFFIPNFKPGGATEKWAYWKWNMSDIFQLKNGGLAWAIEQHYVNNFNENENDCDLSELVVYVDKDNQITKTVVVPKIQTYYRDFVATPSAATLLNDKVYLVYLDNPANANKKDMADIFANRWPEHKRDATTCVMVAEVRDDGTYTKGIAVPASIEAKHFIPKSVVNDGNGNLIFWSTYGNINFITQAVKITPK